MTIEYNSDVALQPTHLNMPFFAEVIENALRETHVKVERVNFSMGSVIGENYLSQIYRAKIRYNLLNGGQSGELSVIIKSMPPTDANAFLDELQVYIKEKIIYTELLPLMQLYLDGDQRFGARIYHWIKEPVNTFVFEDLTTKQFEMASREKGLDEVHARLVLQRLAKFHAISMVLNKRNPELIKKVFTWGMLSKPALERDKSLLLQFFASNTYVLLDTIKKWPGYEDITKKIEKYTSNLKDALARSQNPLPGEVHVLNHGDLWVNNMLFKYDRQRNVQDVIFVDYQMSIWGSPGIDLNYFFYTSLQFDLLKNKRDELLRIYYAIFSETLRQHKFLDVPTYEQIRQEVKQRESFGFFANYGVFPMIIMDKEASSDNSIDNLADKEFALRKLMYTFQLPRVQETLKYTLKRFDELGIWD